MTFFTHGGVQYPLTGDTQHSLLQDADPALYNTLDYLAAVIEYHAGPRLLAQAALEGLTLTRAVKQQLHVEPTPQLLADQFAFPTLALYRKSELYAGRTVLLSHDVSEWEYAYVLPSLTPRQVKALQPILRTVATAVRRALRAGYDDSWKSGASLLTAAGFEYIGAASVRYGGYELINNIGDYYRAIVGTLEVAEREMPDIRGMSAYEGADTNLDHESNDESVVPNLVQTASEPAPTVTAISPTSGTKAGGTTVTITGTGFRVGTPVRVIIGNAECTSPVVLSATQVRAVTSAHDAYDSFLADTDVIADDGKATLVASYTYTTP